MEKKPETTLPDYIRALLEPGAYAGRPEKIELLQTHISYILLTPEFAYKIKKPVDFAFLDFTTLEKRKRFCTEEVRLNRRLAPEVYMGVVGIAESHGRVLMEGEGEPVEYAVKMRRLPGETILEEMLKRDKVTADIIEKVALRIASFHRDAERSDYVSGFGSPEVIRKNTDENFSQTKGFIGSTITPGVYEGIRSYTEGFLEANEALFKRRAKEGFIRDCHGDIHCEHISVSDSINIFDCIEFNERFRFSDVVADISFLSMDLDFHNRADLAGTLDRSYFSASGDAEGPRLLDFYKCYRAYVRGKVEGFKFREREVSAGEKTEAFINSLLHFHLAGQYSSGGIKPRLIIMRGLSGTGKSALAGALSKHTWAVVLSSDLVRKELAGIPPTEHRFEPFGKGIYSKEFTERTYNELIRRGVEYLEAGRTCILDATFSKERFVREAVKKARSAGVGEGNIHMIECTAPEGLVKKRFRERLAEGTPSDMKWGIYQRQKESFEKTAMRGMAIDESRSLKENVLGVIKKIFT
ncbi:MAG TPA: AAA family ATPase [Thermodesulfobacteriota bacterium]|nr:AAA family ATPase [Thermodesulfobacteriota bacterium]